MKIIDTLNVTLFTISTGKLEFKPRLIPTLITVVMLYLLVSLGIWQLHRADYKQHLEQMVDQRSHQVPVDINRAPKNRDDRQYLPVYTQGRFDHKHQILLDNRVVNHRAGYQVYTPLKLPNAPAILVDRGWIAQGKTRQDIPDIAFDIDSQQHIQGILAMPPSSGLQLADNINDFHHWPALAQYIDIKETEKQLGYPLQPMVLILDANNPLTLHREPIQFSMTSDKHLGYAFQWFALATTLTIIYFVVNTKREKMHHD